MILQRYDGVVLNTKGVAQQGVAVTVRDYYTGNVAVIYSDAAASTAVTNPLTSGANGDYFFYARDGRYSIATPSQTLADVMIGTGNGTLVVKTDGLPSITNSTALTNDSTLALYMLPQATYEIMANLVVTSPAAAGFKFAFSTLAAGTSSIMYAELMDISGHVYFEVWRNAASTASSYAGGGTALAGDVVKIHAYYTNSDTAGLVYLQYAQHTSDAGATSVDATSYMISRRIY